MMINWRDGFSIRVNTDGNTVTLAANREGLLSLADILKSLAEEKPGSHVHLDEYNSLEDGSVELIAERIP